MSLPFKDIIHQGPVLAAISKTAWFGLQQHLNKGPGGGIPTVPGPVFQADLPPRDPALVRDYVRQVGGDPSAYKKIVPPHMFPQWGYAMAAKTLVGLPYPVMKVLNGGCRLEIKGPLPQGKPLKVTACMDQLDDNGRRVVLRQRIATSVIGDDQELVVGYLYVIIPLGGNKDKGEGKAKRKPKKVERVPAGAREIGYWKLGPDAGLAYALVSGDFNPVHWVRPYARAFGFKSTILHGFSSMARSMECLNRIIFAGKVGTIRTFDVKFIKPLTLPKKVGCYLAADDAVYVGDAPGGPAYLKGTFEINN